MNATMADGSLELLTGIAERKAPRVWMLWDGVEFQRCEDESVGLPRLAYLTLAGALEATAYFAVKGTTLRPVLVANSVRGPSAERGVEIPNLHIPFNEFDMPEFYLLWTGAEWVTADDSIGDPLVAYLSDDNCQAGYEHHMDLKICNMPILCGYDDEKAAAAVNFRRVTDAQKTFIRELAALGNTHTFIAQATRVPRPTVTMILRSQA